VAAYAHKADVSREDEIQAMLAAMIAKFGTIDILVANAGLQRDAAFDQMTLAQWNTVIGVNLTGDFYARARRSANFGAEAWSKSSHARRERSFA